MNEELLPCPFCGMQAESDSLGIVKCYDPSCGVWQPTIDAWNTRIESAELVTLREQLRAAREALGQVANMDYRGNRPTSAQIAYEALAAIGTEAK